MERITSNDIHEIGFITGHGILKILDNRLKV